MKCPVCDKTYKIENRFEDHLYLHKLSEREVAKIMHDARYNGGEPSPLEYGDVYDRIIQGHYKNSIPYPEPKGFVASTDRLDALRKYREGESAAITRFRADAIEAVGLKGHPKADMAYSMAWSRGHSSGLTEVLINLDELAELLL